MKSSELLFNWLMKHPEVNKDKLKAYNTLKNWYSLSDRSKTVMSQLTKTPKMEGKSLKQIDQLIIKLRNNLPKRPKLFTPPE